MLHPVCSVHIYFMEDKLYRHETLYPQLPCKPLTFNTESLTFPTYQWPKLLLWISSWSHWTAAAPDIQATVFHKPDHIYTLTHKKARILPLMGSSKNMWLRKCKSIFTGLWLEIVNKNVSKPCCSLCMQQFILYSSLVNQEGFSKFLPPTPGCDISFSGICCLLLFLTMDRKSVDSCIKCT